MIRTLDSTASSRLCSIELLASIGNPSGLLLLYANNLNSNDKTLTPDLFMSFKLEQAKTGIVLALAPEALCVETGDDAYLVTFQSGADTVKLKLSPDLLCILGLQCIALMPQIAPDRPVTSTEDSHRLPAQFIKSLDNRSIQSLLRECQSETIVCFLWYMKDGDLIRQVFRSMTQCAAEMMMDDLEQNWRGRNPDESIDPFTQQGRAAVLKILGLARQLAGEGQMVVPESSLTAKEADAMLSGVIRNE